MQILKSMLAFCLLALTSAETAQAVEVWKVLPKNTRFYTGPYVQAFRNGDWTIGTDKAECGMGAVNNYNTMVGISAHLERSCGIFSGCWTIVTNPSIMCSTSALQVNRAGGVRLLVNPGQDARLDTSMGDWARGFTKIECASNQVLTGLADDAVICSPAINFKGATSCNVRWFDERDNRGTLTRGGTTNQNGGDWSYGNNKGECALGEYIKGIVGAPTVALLCCSPKWQ